MGNMRRVYLVIFHTTSLVLLGFGWTLDMLHIDISTHFIVNFNLFNEKRSVIGTLETLWEGSNYWPFLLIFVFGILIPLVKSGVIYYLLLANEPRPFWVSFVKGISKWAMADVFAISIFIAFLGATAMEHTKAWLESGFYYFSAYVLLSAGITWLIGKAPVKNNPV